jgi:zinc transport system substrate-binding protein
VTSPLRPWRVPAAGRLAGGVLALGLLAAGCSAAPSADSGRPSVVAAFYPLQYAAEQVGGDSIDVSGLTPPGVEPHDLELTAAQVAEIAQADVVLYVKGFQPAVDEAVAQQAGDRAVDVAATLPLLGNDPHVWLDPANMAVIGRTIAERLSTVEPDKANALGQNATAFEASMAGLDGEFASGLATCRSRDLVVSHEAFGYLADAYGLTQIGMSGLSPEAEPSPARMKEIADLVRSKGITTVYYETLVDPKVAQTIADETGAVAARLDPLEGLVQGSTDDYASIMRANLATLRSGQGCT